MTINLTCRLVAPGSVQVACDGQPVALHKNDNAVVSFDTQPGAVCVVEATGV